MFNHQPVSPSAARNRARRVKAIREAKFLVPGQKHVVLPAVARPEGYEGPICTMDRHLMSKRGVRHTHDLAGDPDYRRRGGIRATLVA
jgi:hypothetical protein